MEKPIISVKNLGKRYLLGLGGGERYRALRDVMANSVKNLFKRNNKHKDTQEIWALKDVTFDVRAGEKVGIIGRNGAGKSTLLKILSEITEPTEGEARIYGRVASLLEVGTGFHPELTGKENIFMNGAILGMRRAEIKKKFDEIVAFAEIEKFLDTPVKRYSSGMYVRLAFAVAAHLEPEILLIDEVLSVGDAQFQKKCLGKMEDISKSGRTILFVSHNMNSIAALCSRSIMLDSGRVVQFDKSSDVIRGYLASFGKKNTKLVWNDSQSAPGSENIKLHSVCIMSSKGQITTDLDIQEEIIFQVKYWNLKKDGKVIVSIMVKNEIDAVVFSSINLPQENIGEDSWFDKPLPVGLFETHCRFPANFFQTMTYSIDLQLTPILQNFVLAVNEQNIISFTVHDFHGRDTSGVKWQGSIRPRLVWRTNYIGPGA
ncbi:MAG: ABC transporter ATP-binding protein [Candidatus Omnitrophota bacterium]